MSPEGSSFRQFRPVRAPAEIRWRLRMSPYFKRNASVTDSNRRVRTRTHGGVAGVDG
jgi:hypothetical protein